MSYYSLGQSTLSHLHHRKRKREFKGVRKMASSTLIHTLVIKGPDSHFKSTPSATKLVGIVDRMDMKLESKLLSPLDTTVCVCVFYPHLLHVA